MITKSRTPLSNALSIASYVFLLLILSALPADAFFGLKWFAFASLLFSLYFQFIRQWFKTHKFFKNRNAELLKLQGTYATQSSTTSEHRQPYLSENLNSLSGKDKTYQNIIATKSWRYADFEYAVYKNTRYGEYRDETVHYSLLELDLPRRLPNLLFDSKRSHGKQFTPMLDAEQRHSLEGNFDNYFDSYFPKHYSIDALSFITPEVMEAIIDAADFDIEIFGDQLYLYGPIQSPEGIEAMIEKGIAIRKQLLNNITTYRDERLPQSLGRKEVAVHGEILRDNPYRYLGLGLAGVVPIGLGAYLGAQSGDYVNNLTVLGTITLSLPVFHYFKTIANHKKLDEKYAESQLPSNHK